MKLSIEMPVKRRTHGGPTHGRRSAIVFINHSKADEKGTDLKATDKQYYQFQIAFKVRYAGRRSAGMIVIFDPDGNNLGPPIAPP